MSLSLREMKHISPMECFPPVAPEEFKAKPFTFRKTVLDSCNRKTIYATKGQGSFGYLAYVRKRIVLFKTNNYHLALSKNFRIMDIQAPTKSHHDGMDIYAFSKYKLLRRLENYVHFMTKFLVKKSAYIFRLSLCVRRFMKNLKFSALTRLFKTIDLKGKRVKPAEPVYPYHCVVALVGQLPKVAPVSRNLSDELSSNSQDEGFNLSSFESSEED